MKKVWFFIIISCLNVLPQPLCSASEKFRLLDTGSGLFNNQVRFITQMTDGKILVCTEGMFNIYNGNNFEPLTCDLTHTIPLGMHNICTSYDGGDGLLWAKDFYRLYLIDTHTQRFRHDIKERFESARLTQPFSDFILDHDKNAWIITEDGKLYRYDWKSAAELVYAPEKEDSEKGIRVKDVMQAGPFHLIFLNTSKMLIWEEKSKRIVNEDTTLVTSTPLESFRSAWLQADEQHLLISVSHTGGLLYLYNIYTREWKKLLKGKAINDIKKCKNGEFWLAGNYTLIKLSPRYEVLQETNRFELPGYRSITDFILSVCIDDREGLWLGLSSLGVLKAIPEGKQMEYYVNTEIKRDEERLTLSLIPYDDRHLLAGTMQGVYLFDTVEKTFRTFASGNLPMYCTDIKKDRNGAFWISTRKGLYKEYRQEITRMDRTLLPGIESEIIRFSLPLSDGRILVCLNQKDLYICHPENGQALFLNEKFPELHRSRAMSFAIEAKPGKLIFGGQNGLFGYDTDKNKREEVAWIAGMEKYSTKYNCIYTEKDNLWIGTQNGLICHNPGNRKTRRFCKEDGLPNNCIQGITTDLNGNLWISTSCGVGKISRTGKDSYFIAQLDEKDGVAHGEMMEQSIAAMPDGHIYVGGISGLTDIGPQATEHENPNLKPMLVGLSIMNKPIGNEGIFRNRQILPGGLSYTRQFRLKYDENFISMKFSSLNYDTPQHTRYRYRLQGVDNIWNYTSSPTGICTATYTSLTPGTYILQVQSSMGREEWSETSEWKIIMEPPLWKTWWAYTLYILIILTAVYYAIEWYIAGRRSRMIAEQENLKRQKEQHLDELKFRFFTNISHEFRTPLALIITPLELLIRKTGNQPIGKELEKILDNAKDLLRLVNQLLDFRRLEQKGERLNLSVVQLKPFFENNVNQFCELAHAKHIELACECQFTQEETFPMDSGKMTRVLNNLLSNAVKFTPEGGFITLQAGWTETGADANRQEGIRIVVSDTGIGIRPEDLKNIFVRFYQSESTQKEEMNTGSGIGLHLVKGYIDLHKGKITVESTPGKGTSFTIVLPAPDPQPSRTTMPVMAHKASENAERNRNAHPTENKKEITILITEDNRQFREFMQNLLQQEYHIITAADGQEGLLLARERTPDLIISDVMMPRMDGYEFCQKIKTDMQCSHIPFILLTAKNSSQSRSEAYEVGADSFIAKPFNIDVLTSRIRQLLEQRERRRASFRNETQISPKSITITRLDETLIQKALECIEKNMGNADYNVESLSADMGIERSSLYRKMQAIVGLTPTEFMRTIRLKRAAQLLETNQYSVQEISWMVGFNTPRYFSSYFKEMFGLTPTQYAAQKQNTAPKEQAQP